LRTWLGLRKVWQRGGGEEAETCYAHLIRSELQIRDLNHNVARESGLLKCRYRNIPMGDCIIAATAIINKAKVLSGDPHYDVIKEVKEYGCRRMLVYYQTTFFMEILTATLTLFVLHSLFQCFQILGQALNVFNVASD